MTTTTMTREGAAEAIRGYARPGMPLRDALAAARHATSGHPGARARVEQAAAVLELD